MKTYVWLSFYDVINDGQVHIWSSGWRRSRHPLQYKYGPAHHLSPSRTTTKRKIFIFYYLSHTGYGIKGLIKPIYLENDDLLGLQNTEAKDISPIT